MSWCGALERFGEDLEAVLATVTGDGVRAVLVGHSLGGVAVQSFPGGLGGRLLLGHLAGQLQALNRGACERGWWDTTDARFIQENQVPETERFTACDVGKRWLLVLSIGG